MTLQHDSEIHDTATDESIVLEAFQNILDGDGIMSARLSNVRLQSVNNEPLLILGQPFDIFWKVWDDEVAAISISKQGGSLRWL